MQITPNRVVTFLTPLVFAPLAGSIAALAAKYFPGLDIETDQLQAIFIAGATIAAAKAALWMKGWQDWEKRQLPDAVESDQGLEATLAPRSMVTASPAEDIDDVEPDEPDELDAEGDELGDFEEIALADGLDDDLDDPDLADDDLLIEEDDEALIDEAQLLPVGKD